MKKESQVFEDIVQNKIYDQYQRDLFKIDQIIQEKEKVEKYTSKAQNVETSPEKVIPEYQGPYAKSELKFPLVFGQEQSDAFYQKIEEKVENLKAGVFADGDSISARFVRGLDRLKDSKEEEPEKYYKLHINALKLSMENLKERIAKAEDAQTKRVSGLIENMKNSDEEIFGRPSKEACTTMFKELYGGYEYQLTPEALPAGNVVLENEDDIERCALRLEQHLDHTISHLEKLSPRLKDLDESIKYEHHKLKYLISHLESEVSAVQSEMDTA